MVVLPAVLLLAEQGRLRLRGAAGRAGAASTRSARRRGERARPPRLPGGAHRYGWFVALVGVVLVGYVSLQHAAHRALGLAGGLKVGSKVPPFAAPLALGPLDGDVNVARKANQGAAGKRPACTVRGPRDPQLVRARPSAGRSCSPSWPRAARSARASSTALAARARAPPGRAGGRRLDPRRPRRPARARAPPRLALPGGLGPRRASWRTSSASPSARSSPTRCPAAWCRPRASASSTAPGSTGASTALEREARGMTERP